MPVLPLVVGGGLLYAGGVVTGGVATLKVEKMAVYGALMGAAYLALRYAK